VAEARNLLAPNQEPTATPTQQALAVLPTLTPEPTSTPEPTATPLPTSTPLPTATPEPTSTPLPTTIPEPTPPPLPTATPEPPAPAASQFAPGRPVRVQIDPIGMNRSLVSVGLDANRVPIVPNHDAAWYNLSAMPGTGENVVLWGHVLRFSYAPDIPAPFARVQELGIGAPITVYDANGYAHNYVVSEQVWALPSQVEYILPQGSERLTLVSCIGDKVIVNGSVANMSHRLITIATPVD
jgi:hypothetical protein